MRRFVTFLNTQLKISLRDMNMPIFALLMPLVIFLVLGILDEERLSRRPHRQRPPAGLRDAGLDGTLRGPCHPIFPLGIKHAFAL